MQPICNLMVVSIPARGARCIDLEEQGLLVRLPFQSPQGVRDASMVHMFFRMENPGFNPRKGCEMHLTRVRDVHYERGTCFNPRKGCEMHRKMVEVLATINTVQSPQGVRDASLKNSFMDVISWFNPRKGCEMHRIIMHMI